MYDHWNDDVADEIELEADELEEHEDELEEGGSTPAPLAHPLALGGVTLVTAGAVDVLAHLGPTGLVIGAIAALVAARHGGDLVGQIGEWVAGSSASVRPLPPADPIRTGTSKRSFLDRALGRSPESLPADEDEGDDLLPTPEEMDDWHGTQITTKRRRRLGTQLSASKPSYMLPPSRHRSMLNEDDDTRFEMDGMDDLPLPSMGPFVFSSLLTRFRPSVNNIYLGRFADGSEVFCHAKDLCHVAIAGTTGGGKSSLMRLLMAQLCAAGVQVLLLNPHYTSYDVETDEDWTPFERYLAHPPMQCRNKEVIEHFLKTIAEQTIPTRLERRAHSQGVGKPSFIVMDELPSIVRAVPGVSDHMRTILEEGRKVGVYLISAAHDFLVKTISPDKGGGSIRDCYRTAYYVGGDSTTAKVLLDLPASAIAEDELGKGTVMLRSSVTKKARQACVPYVDNASLYLLLGPSTYKPAEQRTMPDPEVLFPAVSTFANVGNAFVNSTETPSGAISSPTREPVFPVSHEGQETEAHAHHVPLAVSSETLASIRKMKNMQYADREIAAIVGLSGRKYATYKQCLVHLGYTKEA